MRYKINVLTLTGARLHYTVKSYKIGQGDFVEFIDEDTWKPKKFHSSRCEIEEIGGVAQ